MNFVNRIFSWLCSLVVAVCVLIMASALPAQALEDTTPPALTGVTVTPSVADIGSGPAQVEVAVSFTDDISGISSIAVTLQNPSGSNTAGANIWTVVSGTSTNGTWSGVLTIPQYSEIGDYSVDVSLHDEAGNSNYLNDVASFQVEADDAPVDATLSALSLSSGSLAPTFSSSTRNYTATVSAATDSITLTPSATDERATVTVNGAPVASGSASGALSLNVGSNPIVVAVSDADGTSIQSYTVTVIREAPIMLSVSPTVGQLQRGYVGAAYTQTFTATGGSGSYNYALLGDMPAGMSLDPATGILSGMPFAPRTFSFTISAIDVNDPAIRGSSAYTLDVALAPNLTLNPADGSTLPDAMAGESYSFTIIASGGTSSVVFQTVEGSLPRGMVLNLSTGEITGPPDTAASGSYHFTVQASDAEGTTQTASYTLTVVDQAPTIADHQVAVPEGGTPPNFDLTRGATGGPFLDAVIASVEPPYAGTAQIVHTELAQLGGASPLQFYLKFTPNPAFSGQARVNYQLVSALGTSNVGTVIYSLTSSAGAVTNEIDNLVRGFVQTRQSLIASTISVPGLLDRRGTETAVDPITARMSPSTDGLTLGFASSLGQLNAARNAADGIATEAAPSAFNIWFGGSLMVHNRDENGDRWGNFGMVSAGTDALIADKALIGLSFHYDRMTDPTNADAKLTGDGWLAGPYVSFEIGNGVFWDTSLLYGGSSNTIDTTLWDGAFDTRRWLFDTSISGQWQLDQVTTLTPKLRGVYLNEAVDDYSVDNDGADVVAIEGFTAEQLRVSVGAEIARQISLANRSELTPVIGLTGGFSDLDGSGAFGQVSAGLSYQSPKSWTISGRLLVNIEGEGQISVGSKAAVGVRF